MSDESMLHQKPLMRMMLYIGMKLETMERCYAIQQEDGSLKWASEFAKGEHEILTEVHKTIELVQRFEPEFKQILRRNLAPPKKKSR